MSLFDYTRELSVLSNLGDVVETNIWVDCKLVNQNLLLFKDEWKIYNPRDTKNNRYGLSLTSLDGGLSGIPDLDSLSLYNKEYGIEYLEEEFNKPTEVLESIREATRVFEKYEIGRSHVLRLDKGGHFPRHRDLCDTFRLIAFLDCDPPESMTFTLEDKVLHLRCGRFYFINTIKDHSLFSFRDDQKIIVLNVLLNEKNVNQLYKDRMIR
jgi:hypothetical protein